MKANLSQFNFIFLGISAAIPTFALGIPFGLWLLSAGVSKETFGLITVSSLIVALNFLWSPFINNIKIPILHKLLGLRRSWLLLSQVSLSILLFTLSILDPLQNITLIVLIACLIYFFSSVQDIALDAYRVEYDKFSSPENLSTIYQLGYKIGAFLVGAQVYSLIGEDNWGFVYFYLAFLMLILPFFTLISKKVDELNLNQSTLTAFKEAFKNLFQKNNVVVLLILIGVYKISDIVLGPMAAALYKETALDDPSFLEMKSYFNFIATFVGAGIALLSIKYLKINISMLLGAILVLSTNILFSYLYLNPSYLNFISINFLDTIAQSFTAVCFITFLVDLIDRKFTAIQYAFLASLVIVPGTIIKGSSGFILEGFGYYNFFILMGVLAIPSVCLCYLLPRNLELNFENIMKIISIALALSIFLISIYNFDQNFSNLDDKLLHVVMYVLLAVITFTASKKTNSYILFVVLILIGVATEVTQMLFGLRNFEYMDIIANSLGVLIGFVFYYISEKYLKKTQ